MLGACGHKSEPGNADTANLGIDNADTANLGIDNAGMNTAATVQANADQGFVNAAGASDRFEIESSQLAASSASSPAIKAFAAKMIAAHTTSTQKLKAAAGALSPALTVDDTLSATQQQAMDGLKGKTGADFDSAYAAAQVNGHQAALEMLKDYAASGDNANLKGVANGLIPTVTAHLNMAKSLK
jgi:putative membrane protein